MKLSSPARMASEHTSPWARFAIRLFSIHGAPWILLGLSLLATTLVCQQAWKAQQVARKMRFENDAAILRNAMFERLNRYGQVLTGVRGLFAASQSIEAAEFGAYVSSLQTQRDYPGILALGYVERVAPGQRAEFIRQLNLDYQTTASPVRISPSGERHVYHVIRFVEPLDTNRSALGFDIGSEANRLSAATRACQTAGKVLSPKIELVQAPGKPAAVLFEPVYPGCDPPDDPATRQADLQGWVYAAFLVDDMMAGVRQLTKSPLDYEIFDGGQTRSDALLCMSGSPPSPENLEQSMTSELFGQPWTLRIHTPPETYLASGMLPVGLLVVGGLCMSLLVFGVAHSMATTSRRSYTLAINMTSKLQNQREELEASEDRLSMVIKGSNDGIWDWNIRTNDVYFSPRWKSMLGYTDDEIENSFSAWEKLVHPDDLEHARDVINRYFENRIPSYKLEHRLRHKDGSYRWILTRGVASRSPDGSPTRMAGSHVDLTELKQAEQNLRQANDNLRRSQRELQSTLADLGDSHSELKMTQLELIQAAKLESAGTLAAGVAHEVKNPLQVIIMGLDYLDTRIDDGEEITRITLNDMRDAALRADGITRELLQFSNATEFAPEPIGLAQVLERSLWLIRAESKKSGARVVTHLADELPPVSIDIPKIQQVLINLMMNALQAMPAKGVLTLTSAVSSLDSLLHAQTSKASPLKPEQQVVSLRIRDNGPGIPDDELSRIFDPFFTTKGVGAGNGLGLSVVKKIIDLHGALIHFRNSPRGGLEVILAFAAIPENHAPSSAVSGNVAASASLQT